MGKHACLGVMLVAGGCVVLNPSFDEDGSGNGQSTDVDASTASSPSGPSDSAPPTEPTASSMSTSLSTSTDPGATDGSDSSTSGVVNDWWNEAFGMRVSLKFEPRKEALFDFCAFVDVEFDVEVDGPVFLGLQRNQVAFVDVASGVRIPSEVVHVSDQGGRLRAWVSLPVWDERVTEVDLYWDADAPELDPLNPWGSDYLGVWHMDAISDTSHVRNSAGGPPAVAAGISPPANSAGVAYRSVAFDGRQDRMGADFDGMNVASYFTASAWASVASFTQAGAPVFARGGRVGTQSSQTEWFLRFHAVETYALVHTEELTSVTLPTEAPVIGSWHHYVLQANPQEVVLYLDGVRVAISDQDYVGIPNHELSLFSIGGYADPEEMEWSNRLFHGLIDEVVWRQGGDLSDVWIETMFENQWNPDDTYDVGWLEELR